MTIRSVSIAAPSLGGGGMTRAYFIADLLRHMGVDVEIIVHLPPGKEVYPAQPPELAVTTVTGDRVWKFGPRLIRNLTGDAIIAVKPRTSSFGMALVAGRKTRRAVVLDVDDWELSYGFRGLAKGAEKAVLERMVGFADAVTVNNTYLRRRYGGTLLPSGRDGRLFDPSRYDGDVCRRSLGLEDRFVLMFPGTAVPHSGLEDLLLAMDSVTREDLLLVVVGGRSSGVDYVSNKLRSWSARILHLPERPRDQLPAVLAAAHLFVVPHRDMPTSRHNFPMKLIDAMAMAKPTLATRVGDIPRALDGAGYLVAPNTPSEIADALQLILSDPGESARRGRLARERFEKHFSLDALAPIMTDLLSRLSRSRK